MFESHITLTSPQLRIVKNSVLMQYARPAMPHYHWFIRVTSNERHVVSDHRPFDWLFNSLCGPTSKKHESPHYWPFVRGIHWWLVTSPHKGPVTRKKLPFDIVTVYLPVRRLYKDAVLPVQKFPAIDKTVPIPAKMIFILKQGPCGVHRIDAFEGENFQYHLCHWFWNMKLF